MKFTAQQIADILEGKVDGNPSEEVSKLSKLFKFGVFELVYCQLFSMNNVSLLQQPPPHFVARLSE